MPFKTYHIDTFILLMILVLLSSCHEMKEAQMDHKKSMVNIQDDSKSESSEFKSIKIYTLPTPLQVSSSIQAFNLNMDERSLSKLQNSSNLNTDVSRAYVLGMRTIDLGHSTVFNKGNEAITQLTEIEGLLHQLGIEGPEEKGLLIRFKNNSENKDSLYFIVLKTYESGYQWFQENQQESLGMMVITGGFVRNLELLLTVNDKSDQVFLNMLGQQKLFLENILEMTSIHKENQEISKIYAGLEKLHLTFKPIKLNFKDPAMKPFKVMSQSVADSTLRNISAHLTSIKNSVI